MVLGLALALALTPTVALVFADHTEFVPLPVAEREFRDLEFTIRDAEQEKRLAALVVALGTQPTTRAQTCPDNHPPRCETMRGRRLPLQGSGR